MPRHPGRVERVDGVRGRGSPALAGSLPYPHHLKEGKEEDEAGRMTHSPRRCPVAAGRWRSVARWWRGGGEVVARWGDDIAQNLTGWPSFPHPGRCCERVRW